MYGPFSLVVVCGVGYKLIVVDCEPLEYPSPRFLLAWELRQSLSPKLKHALVRFLVRLMRRQERKGDRL